jgi:hypothetical protein
VGDVPVPEVAINHLSVTIDLRAETMPWQEELLWRLRHPSLLKYLFIVLTVYSRNVGARDLSGQAEK